MHAGVGQDLNILQHVAQLNITRYMTQYLAHLIHVIGRDLGVYPLGVWALDLKHALVVTAMHTPVWTYGQPVLLLIHLFHGTPHSVCSTSHLT